MKYDVHTMENSKNCLWPLLLIPFRSSRNGRKIPFWYANRNEKTPIPPWIKFRVISVNFGHFKIFRWILAEIEVSTGMKLASSFFYSFTVNVNSRSDLLPNHFREKKKKDKKKKKRTKARVLAAVTHLKLVFFTSTICTTLKLVFFSFAIYTIATSINFYITTTSINFLRHKVRNEIQVIRFWDKE